VAQALAVLLETTVTCGLCHLANHGLVQAGSVLRGRPPWALPLRSFFPLDTQAQSWLQPSLVSSKGQGPARFN
jgi:hypothetical protein